jgi:endonuclease III
MNKKEKTQKIVSLLRKSTKKFDPTLMEKIISEYGKNPYLILVSCLLSLRAKDSTTINVCHDLFKIAKTPEDLRKIPLQKLEHIIFKTGLYKSKAKTLLSIKTVPRSIDGLLKIKGIGRKTANLTVGLAFGIPAICVDTHVHRISNRLGLVKTKNTLETEIALQKVLPKEFWILWNKLLVLWGQNICKPRRLKCSACVLRELCSFKQRFDF